MTTDRPSVGILGAGWVAENCYAPALAATGMKLRAVHDCDSEIAAQFVRRLGMGEAIADLDRFLAVDVDLVVVATPNATHAALVRRALEAGRTVLSEKPLATNRAEVEGLLFAGNRLHVSSPFRFREDYGALLERVRAGDLGQIHRIRAEWVRSKGIPRPGSWYTDRRRAGGGVLADLGAHVLDLTLLLMGGSRLHRIQTWTASLLVNSETHASPWMHGVADNSPGPVIDVEDQAVVHGVLEGGGLLEVHLSWAGFRPHDRTRFEVEGSRGRAVLDTLLGYSSIAPPSPPRLWIRTRKKASESRTFHFERRPAHDFGRMLEAIFGGSSPGRARPATVEEAWSVADFIEQAYGSAAGARSSQ
ncbi:MAG: Gfo/Idh/MocA family oxidoreductase [bacterium]|nr:Gfo/Idh/MocA family oxidoreductase [bacterium]